MTLSVIRCLRVRTVRCLPFIVVCICFPALARTAKKDVTWPRVVYIINFGSREQNDAAVIAIQNCCESETKAQIATSGKCPEGNPCEFLRLEVVENKYIIHNEYYPPNSQEHPKMMERAVPFGAKDDAHRQAEILKNLRALVTCHERLHGEQAAHPGNPELFCQSCSGLPTVPDFLRGQGH
jgi:hypothetical protein